MYSVVIDLTSKRESLHDIEKGNPVRFFTVPTLAAAVSVCNAVRMTAGLAMVHGPRSIHVGQWAEMANPMTDGVRLEIQRLKGKA